MASTDTVMFHGFSFESSPRRSHAMTTLSPHCMPKNSSELSTSDLNLLSQQFGQQTITSRPRPQSFYMPSYQPQQSQQSYASNYSYQPSYQPAFPCRHMCAESVRSQRQTASRLQTQASHTRETSSLVERMVQSGEQCSICSPPIRRQQTYPPPQPQAPMDEDEGFDEPDEFEMPITCSRLSYRRSTDFSTLEGRVVRPIRIRKKHKSRKSESSKTGSSSAA